jgi:two-component system, chemotaxis family, sensor kinase CheA
MGKEDEYKEIFLAEALEGYEELNNLFTDLEKNISDKNAIDAIFRITHTLKGNAMGMGFNEIAELSHLMEDLFNEVKSERISLSRDIFATLFKANDVLGQLIHSLNTGEIVKYKGIKTKLEVLLKNTRPSSPSVQVPPIISQPTNSATKIETKKVEEKIEDDAKEEEIKTSISNDIDTKPTNTNEEGVTLFEKVGGKEAINAVVDIFYNKLISDEVLKDFFVASDMNLQRIKLAGFLAHILGSPVNYSGLNMKEAHARFSIAEIHFNIFCNHLAESFNKIGIDNQTIEAIMKIIQSMSKEIVNSTEVVKPQIVEVKNDVDALKVEEPIEKTTEKLDDYEETISSNILSTTTDEDLDELNDLISSQKIIISDVVQVPVRKLDALLNIVGELIIEKDTLNALNIERGYQSNDLARLNRITSDLQYGVMDVRLVQIGFLFNKFNRILRDVADIENKKVDLILEGTEIEIDRNILKIMSDSLVHLVRNSVSHGIEAPKKRVEKGKPKAGKVTLRAINEKDTVLIEVIDDGNGIDPQAIKRKAIEKGMLLPENAKNISDDEAIMFIFEPGFSNADSITEVSGRGVGMDVVKKATESIGGKIMVKTELGKGSTFTLVLPSSMAVKGALLFELNNQEYAIALSYTEAVVSLRKKDIHKVNSGLVSKYLGKTISVLFLKDLFGKSMKKLTPEEKTFHQSYDELKNDEKLDVVIVSYANKYIGLIVDKLMQQKEIVEKTLFNPVDKIPLISGATILGNGDVCLVLDIPSIINTLFKEKMNHKI